VEAAQDAKEGDAGKPLRRVRENIDQAGVRKGREDEQALVRQVDGDEPLIHQELIGGPLASGVQSVLAGHALFEGRHPRDLAADEDGVR
jgi:hypothetical protein